jgi:hypothetical protein
MLIKKVCLISILFSSVSISPAFCQSSSAPISFTKKEIAFFKWGEGKKEVKLVSYKEKNIYHGMDLGGYRYTYNWPKKMEIDGNDNIYLYSGTERIFVISSEGNSIKTIDAEKTGGVVCVDEFGNIYGSYRKKGEPTGFILTKPDGTQTLYKDFLFGGEENGVVFPANLNDMLGKQPITIFSNDDKPEKSPPHLSSGYGNMDCEEKNRHSLIIHTGKINKHLKKINKKIEADEIPIELEVKNRFWPLASLVGVDDNCNFYILCRYSHGPGIEAPYEEADMMVYSQTGQKIFEIPMELDCFDKHLSGIKLDIQGNVFQMYASEDGLHVIEWVKN